MLSLKAGRSAASTAYRIAMRTFFADPLPFKGLVSSDYGPRTDPFTGLKSFHRGIDIVAPIGTRVLASNGGLVKEVGESWLYGNYVVLEHQGGFQTLYAHLSKWAVVENRRVDYGDKIGEVGTTGRSTGPHLHFSIYKNGDDLNPSVYLLNY